MSSSTPERHWLNLDLDRTRRFHDPETSLRAELALVRTEHAGTESMDRPCPAESCGGVMQFRPTVGALSCIRCGTLARSGSGAVIGGPR